ncbi:MAG: site-specific DNA-methyltransferase [Gammaproteobacteria bacterium]
MARAKAPNIIWHSNDGESSLYRGDQLALMSRLPDESFDCIWTDPPYFLSNNGTTCAAGRRTTVNKGKWYRSRGIEDDHAFNVEWLSECYRLLTPAGTIWVSGTQHVYFSVGMALQQIGFRLLNDIVWEKPNPPPNLGCRCFTHATEMLLWATKAPKGSRERYTFNYTEMKQINGNRQMKNVWRFSAPGNDEKQHGKHPTQKPVALIERCLRASTSLGDLVFDPFSGSATTGVAALNLGRRFVGCEIDAKFARLASKRLASADAESQSANTL